MRHIAIYKVDPEHNAGKNKLTCIVTFNPPNSTTLVDSTDGYLIPGDFVCDMKDVISLTNLKE